LAGTQQRRSQLILWQRASDRPHALDGVALRYNCERGEDSADSGSEVVQLPQPADGLLDAGDAVAWKVAVICRGVELCKYDQLLPPAMSLSNRMHLHLGTVRGCRSGLAQRTDARR
jgi:hypothetical protein